MKKFFAILLVILCVLTLSSCVSFGSEKAPAWLRGKTWTGTETFDTEEGSVEVDCSYSFNEDGEFNFEEYLGYYPDDRIITTSGNSKSYKISIVGVTDFDGITYVSEDILIFTKISNSECEFNAIFKMSKYTGEEDTMLSGGTLYAN